MLMAWENLLYTDLKEKTDSNTLRFENFNSAFTSMGTSSRLNRKKISKGTVALNDILDEMNL